MFYLFSPPEAIRTPDDFGHVFCAVKNGDGGYAVADCALCSRARRRGGTAFEAVETLVRAAEITALLEHDCRKICPVCAEKLRSAENAARRQRESV